VTCSIVFTKKARKQIDKLDPKQKQIIKAWIRDNLQDCKNPRRVANSDVLKGVAGGWRYRVGKYRLLTVIKDSEITVEVFRVGHRKSVYERLS